MVNLYEQQIRHPQPNHQKAQQQQQQQPEQQIQQYQPYNNKHLIYNNINKYASNRPKVQTIVYNTHHQANKPYEAQVQQHNANAQKVNYNHIKVEKS